MDDRGNRAVFSLYAATAFDSIEWPSLLEVLASFELGDKFIRWIQTGYAAMARRFRIKDPLSCLLFALALELLVALVR